MLTYSQLDVIADSYIPLLAIISLCRLAMETAKSGVKKAFFELMLMVAAVFIVYMLMFIDNQFHIWPMLGLDYSTHTALSLVFVVYLSSKNHTLLLWSICSFLCYALLMIYQQYHTAADIFSTGIVLLPICWLLFVRAAVLNKDNVHIDNACP